MFLGSLGGKEEAVPILSGILIQCKMLPSPVARFIGKRETQVRFLQLAVSL